MKAPAILRLNMKFKYIGSGLNNYYGINAANGDVIEEERGNIINKMKSHPEFEEEKTVRTRRTKEQIEADKAKEDEQD